MLKCKSIKSQNKIYRPAASIARPGKVSKKKVKTLAAFYIPSHNAFPTKIVSHTLLA